MMPGIDGFEVIRRLRANPETVDIRIVILSALNSNEDMAILDAEMNNAKLREEAQRLKAQNEITTLLGFLVMFAIAFVSILVSQARLRENLDQMREKNRKILIARQAYRQALDAKEAENSLKTKILQNRKSNSFQL